MSQPDKKIAQALLESYMTMRKKSWGIKDDASNISSKTNAQSRAISKLLFKIQDAKTVDDWIQLIYAIREQELSEFHNYGQRNIVHRMLTEPLLGHTLKALRSFVLSQLTSDDFNSYVSSIDKNLQVAGKEALVSAEHMAMLTKQKAALGDDKGYYEQYFKTYVSKVTLPDAAVKGAFANYCANILTDNKPLILCDALLKNDGANATDVKDAAAAAASSAPAAPPADTKKTASVSAATAATDAATQAAYEAEVAALETGRKEKERQDMIAADAKEKAVKAKAEADRKKKESEERRVAEEARARDTAVPKSDMTRRLQPPGTSAATSEHTVFGGSDTRRRRAAQNTAPNTRASSHNRPHQHN